MVRKYWHKVYTCLICGNKAYTVNWGLVLGIWCDFCKKYLGIGEYEVKVYERDTKMPYISIKESVIRTPQADRVIERLEPYFANENHYATICSILRNPAEQFHIIYNYGVRGGYFKSDEHPLIIFETEEIEYEGKTVKFWQLIWSLELEDGLLIAPPYHAEILCGIRRGQTREASNHFKGSAIDFSTMNDLDILTKAKKEDEELGKMIVQILVERQNNCIHVDTQPLPA